jgi:hypothetical protein
LPVDFYITESVSLLSLLVVDACIPTMAAATARRVASRVLPSGTSSSVLLGGGREAVAREGMVNLLTSPSILVPGQDKVICRWWRGAEAEPVVDPDRYLIDGQGKITAHDVHPDSALASEMRAKYADTGLCHLTNTGLTDMVLQRNLARILMGNESEYEGGANPRGRNVDLGNVYDIGAPLTAALAYHHEVTYKEHSVTQLGFLCRKAVNRGEEGWSFVSDSVQAHDALMETELGQKLKERGLCFVRRMTDRNAITDASNNSPVYNHWQQSWMTNDPVEAEQKARDQGLEVVWTHHPQLGRQMETRYYASAFEYVADLDRNLLVTSIAGKRTNSWLNTVIGCLCRLTLHSFL